MAVTSVIIYGCSQKQVSETNATLSGSNSAEKTPTPCHHHGVASVLPDMKSNDAPDLKTSGPTDASTAREAVLSWAEQQPWVRERATRALVSIHQTHLSYYDQP